MQCKARQYSDQMCCGKCMLQWDVNDPNPPTCGQQATVNALDDAVHQVKCVQEALRNARS